MKSCVFDLFIFSFIVVCEWVTEFSNESTVHIKTMYTVLEQFHVFLFYNIESEQIECHLFDTDAAK